MNIIAAEIALLWSLIIKCFHRTQTRRKRLLFYPLDGDKIHPSKDAGSVQLAMSFELTAKSVVGPIGV